VNYPPSLAPRTLWYMVQPVVRIGSQHAALEAARALETPSEVQRFEAHGSKSAAVRAFLATPEWTEIRTRILGDGRPPLGRLTSLGDLSRLMRWAADGAFAEGRVSADARGAYLHAAQELDAFSRARSRVAPVSPAPAGPAQPGALSFGDALAALKAGQHATRAVWPAGTYVTSQAGHPAGIGINAHTAAATGLPEGTSVAFAPHLMQMQPSSAPGTPMSARPWTPDQDDLFSEDWRVISHH
jgi:Protein of unknown function (DUF2829)